MPLTNYTTSVAADRTIAKITKLLVKAGARDIGLRYDEQGHATALNFALRVHGDYQAYRLPVRIGAVQDQLKLDRVERRYLTLDHSEKVAWRIIEDWLRAQLAIMATGMVKFDEVMFPYLILDRGETVYDRYEISNQLPAGSAS